MSYTYYVYSRHTKKPGAVMHKNKKLTPVEWEIMEAVWEADRAPSVRDIVDMKYPNGEKAYTTIQTIMNTLEKKGLLSREKIGLVNFYTPQKTRHQMAKAELTQMISRVFHGSVPALANFLLDEDNLSLNDISDLKKLLQQKEQELKTKK